jgi:hypothetical protein
MENRVTRALRARPHLIFWSCGLNVALCTYLLAMGARLKVIVMGGLFATAFLGLIYLCIRGGYVLTSGKRYTIEDTPRDFWVNMAICYALYLAASFSVVLIHLQDLKRIP